MRYKDLVPGRNLSASGSVANILKLRLSYSGIPIGPAKQPKLGAQRDGSFWPNRTFAPPGLRRVAKLVNFVLTGRMSDDAFSPLLEPCYAAALGAAVFAFASLEWDAVQSCEALQLGSIEGLEDRTAGRVADTLLHLVKGAASQRSGEELQRAAEDFKFLVGTRNNLVHAKPGVTSDREQRLYRHGDQWTLAELEGVAEAFAGCSDRLVGALENLPRVAR